ncbi:MAG TPA: SRPBCC domain-containing protein, partial [Rhodanobacteraceae bacterium]
GARLAVTIQPASGKATRFAPTVLAVVPQRELRWLGQLPLPGLFAGEHRLALEPGSDGSVRFIQSERFTGLLVGPLRRGLERGTRRGFEAMNAALKARAENVRHAITLPTIA